MYLFVSSSCVVFPCLYVAVVVVAAFQMSLPPLLLLRIGLAYSSSSSSAATSSSSSLSLSTCHRSSGSRGEKKSQKPKNQKRNEIDRSPNTEKSEMRQVRKLGHTRLRGTLYLKLYKI